MRTRDERRRSAGFTLIELMVVVIILGILAATISLQLAGTTQDAKRNRARADIATIGTAIDAFQLNTDRYPTTEEGLNALMTPPSDAADRWRGPYLKDLNNDPWNHPYLYRFPGTKGPRSYDIWSRGADNAEGGEGPNADVRSWEKQ
jgi:general secretion pathway protein G